MQELLPTQAQISKYSCSTEIPICFRVIQEILPSYKLLAAVGHYFNWQEMELHLGVCWNSALYVVISTANKISSAL